MVNAFLLDSLELTAQSQIDLSKNLVAQAALYAKNHLGDKKLIWVYQRH